MDSFENILNFNDAEQVYIKDKPEGCTTKIKLEVDYVDPVEFRDLIKTDNTCIKTEKIKEEYIHNQSGIHTYFKLENAEMHIQKDIKNFDASNNKMYDCNICGKTFASSRGLKSHSVVHSSEKKYKCDICEKTFARSDSLRRHTIVHTGEKKYKCDICEKTFALNGSLKKHSVVHTGVKNYKCDVCGSCFAFSSGLKRHSFIHTFK